MKMRFVPVWVLPFLGIVAVSGCMVGPDYQRPKTAAQTATSFVNAPKGVQDVNTAKPADANSTAEQDQWWTRFGDPVTADLVKEALENNNDLKAAAARVLQAQTGLVQASAGLWPSVSYDLGRTRSKSYFNLGDVPGLPSGGFSPLTTTWNQGINVSYLVDFWGQLRRTEEAAWAETLGAEAGRQKTMNSIVSTVIQARINIAVLQRRLAIVRANIEGRQRTLDLTERRYQGGLVGPVDVRLARASLEADKTQEPAMETSLAQAIHALDVVLGKQPGTSPSLPQTLPELPQLEAVPLGVPAALLERRPDVRTAEFSLRAANERIGASVAGLFPGLTITASYGRSASNWEDIWKHFSETYSLGLNLTQPLFEGGKLRAQVDAAEARYAELAADYSATVLRAMQEVEDALISEQSLQKQVEHASLQLNEARAAEDLSRRRYENGVESILAVLESERNRRLAEDQVAVLKGQIWTTRVNLHLALGGDWAEHQSDKKTAGAATSVNEADVAHLP